MKVALDCRYVRRVPTGVGAVVKQLATRLPEHAPELELVLLTHPDRPVLSTAPNVTHLVPPFVADGPGTLFALGPWLRTKVKVDVFHATFSLMPWMLGVPTVVTLHDTMWLTAPGMVRSPGTFGRFERRFYAPATWHGLRAADEVLVPTGAVRDDILRLAPDAPPITVTPWGLTDTSEPDATVTARNGLVPRGYVLTVGRAAGYKNHEAVVAAFAKAFPPGSPVKLVLVQRRTGTGAALHALARAGGVDDRVLFLPELSGPELAGLYASAMCLCHPSWIEGFGLPILEAMHHGCPVVTSNRSAMPEAADGAALLVDPASVDDVARGLRACAAADERERLTRVGAERVRRATWELALERTVAAYRRAAGRRR